MYTYTYTYIIYIYTYEILKTMWIAQYRSTYSCEKLMEKVVQWIVDGLETKYQIWLHVSSLSSIKSSAGIIAS